MGDMQEKLPTFFQMLTVMEKTRWKVWNTHTLALVWFSMHSASGDGARR